jgi:hypothetical protein
MLTLLSFRSEETAGKAFLRALLDRAGRDIWSAIALDPLTDDEARTLIGALVPADAMLDEDGRRQLTREAAGSPFVLEQLARYAGLRIPGPGHSPTCSRRGLNRSRRMRTACSKLWRSAAGRCRPTWSVMPAGSQASGSL